MNTPSRISRISINLMNIGFLIPLLSLLSFGNEQFIDANLSSILLLTWYCLLVLVQLVFLAVNKEMTLPEIFVYTVLFVITVIITAFMYRVQYLTGVDGQKNYILNITSLAVSGVAAVHEMIDERRRLVA